MSVGVGIGGYGFNDAANNLVIMNQLTDYGIRMVVVWPIG